MVICLLEGDDQVEMCVRNHFESFNSVPVLLHIPCSEKVKNLPLPHGHGEEVTQVNVIDGLDS